MINQKTSESPTLILILILFGICYVILGFNLVAPIVPLPPLSGEISQLINKWAQTGFAFEVAGSLLCLGGILLIVNRYVTRGVIVLLPATVILVAFQAIYANDQLWFGLMVATLNVVLLIQRLQHQQR